MHLALKCSVSDDVVRAVLAANPAAAQEVDVFGRLPLHHMPSPDAGEVLSDDDVEIAAQLLQVFPGAARIEDKYGRWLLDGMW